MHKESFRDFLKSVFTEAGFVRTKRCYRNNRFILALLAGIPVVWVMHGWLQPYPAEVQFSVVQLLSLIIWQPLVEEVLFRGIIQGQFARREWGRRTLLGISGANTVTSILFVAVHMINSPPLFALTVMVPSLVFGYFRDYCNSVYPSIIIHSTYNSMVFAGLFLSGSLVITL